jgi:hypothetical protein
MAVDQVILAPESFRTIYLRKEDRVILRTERGRKIIIKRIIPDEWKEYRIYDFERDRNESKKEIFLFDNRFLPQLTKEFLKTIKADEE